MLGPKREGADVAGACLPPQPPERQPRAGGPARGEQVRRLVQETPPPGVLAYDGGEVVGWAAVYLERHELPARNRKIPFVDDIDVWSVWCIRVRPRHRGRGIFTILLQALSTSPSGFDRTRHRGLPGRTIKEQRST